jgi:hypothetical protein
MDPLPDVDEDVPESTLLAGVAGGAVLSQKWGGAQVRFEPETAADELGHLGVVMT